jgi:hypothetical protein
MSFTALKGQQLQQTTQLGDLKVTYHLKNGQFEGYYKSVYPNGKTQAEGYFKDNKRHGEWNIYDDKAGIMHSRVYKNPYHFDRKYPPLPHIELVKMLMAHPVVTQRDENGILRHPTLDENDIFWSKRLWLEAKPQGNKALFKKGVLAKQLANGIKSGRIKEVFKDDRFTEPIDSINYTDFNRVVAFRFKQDRAYVLPNGTMNSYMIAICPVIEVGDSIKTQRELCWIWYPDCRKELAKAGADVNGKVSLDDVIFEQDFSALIYKEDLPIKDMPKKRMTKEQSLELELKLIELEHSFWMNKLEYTYN